MEFFTQTFFAIDLLAFLFCQKNIPGRKWANIMTAAAWILLLVYGIANIYRMASGQLNPMQTVIVILIVFAFAGAAWLQMVHGRRQSNRK